MQYIKLIKNTVSHAWVIPAITVMAVAIYIVYPGGFSPDSFVMYDMANGTKNLTDIKPIFSVLLMRLGINIFGDAGLVIINAAVYLLGVTLISAALFSHFLSRLFTSLLLVSYPPLLLVNLSNWIDPIVLSGLSVSIGCILLYVYRKKSLFLLCSAAFFSIWAILARHNAPSIVFFIQLPIVYLFVKHCFPSKNQRLAVFLGIVVLFGGSLTISPLLNKSFEVKHIPIWGWIYNYDIVSISLLENKNLLPRGVLNVKYRDKSDEEILAALQKVFVPHHAWYLGGIINRDIELKFMNYSIRTALNYPGSLLLTRYRINAAWLTEPDTAYIISSSIKRSLKHGIEPQNKRKKIFRKFIQTANRLRLETPLFLGGWYILMASFLFVSLSVLWILLPESQLLKKERPLVISLSLAGIFTWLPLVPMTVSAEFRYLTPTVFLMIVSVLILLRYSKVVLNRKISAYRNTEQTLR